MAAVVCPGPQALREAEVLRATLKSCMYIRSEEQLEVSIWQQLVFPSIYPYALEQSSFEDFNVGSSGWSSRQMLQDLYKNILLNDLEFALDKKVEQDLWNYSFKSQIDFLRHQTKDHKGSKSSEIQAVLSLFLEAASGFYIQLLQEFCLHYNLDLPGHAKSSHLGILEDGYADCLIKKPHSQSCYYVCQDCLVHLGDIARYCDDSYQAELFYRHALILVPSNGQPYNQLAILASAKGDQLGTVYFYCRSIAVKNPFPAASTNLHKIFSKICSRHSTISSTDAISSAEFFLLFLQFHGHIYLDQDLSEARHLKNTITEGFKFLLQQNTLQQDDYIHLVAITLFSLYHIKSSRVDELEEFDCISKDDEDGWQLALELAVNLFNTVLIQQTNQPDTASHPLVYISVFCQWIASNASSSWREDAIKSTIAWDRFASLLNHLSSSCENFNADLPDTALHEDWELHAFVPLNSFHKKLNFTMKKTQIENEATHRINRLLQFGSRLSSHSPRDANKPPENRPFRWRDNVFPFQTVIPKNISTGLAKFSLRTESSISENTFIGLQEIVPKSPGELDLDTAGQRLSSLPTPTFLPQKASSPTPFAETSSLFNNASQGVIGGPLQGASFPAPQVPQYSLFQSGWKAPLTSAFGTTGSPSPSPSEKQFAIERAHQADQSPVGHKFLSQATVVGAVGECQPISSIVSPYSGAPRPPGYSTPSPGPLEGFGLSENWGSGVWGPVKGGANNNPTPPQQVHVQSMWGQEFSPGQGLSPLQQLLHDQQKRKDSGT